VPRGYLVNLDATFPSASFDEGAGWTGSKEVNVASSDSWGTRPGRLSGWELGLLLGFALAVRLLLFTGLSYGDDVIYVSQVISHAESASWPPEPTHWSTRLGLTLPTTLSVWLLGLRPIGFIFWPLLASLIKVIVAWRIAGFFLDRRAALLAAYLLAAFPVEVIFATHLFPDLIVGLFSTLSLWFWIRALKEDRATFYLASGGFFAIGYLCRETVILEGPIYLLLWLVEGRLARPRLLWVALVPLLLLGIELSVYAATTGSTFYRWTAIRSAQGHDQVIGMHLASHAGGSFWTDPILVALASHELGLYFGPALVIAAYALLKNESLRPVAAWLLAGFLWLNFGTTVPNGWVTLQREPRYWAVLTVPCVIQLAHFLMSLKPWARWTCTALLISSGLFGASLDQGSATLSCHRAFIASPYAEASALEPFDYIASRWALGLKIQPRFACVDDCGRSSIVHGCAALEMTRLCKASEARYLVFFPSVRPDLRKRMTSEGWKKMAEFPCHVNGNRAVIGRLLSIVPSQRERANRMLHPPGLVVLANPAYKAPSPSAVASALTTSGAPNP
jgi:hypothetical protein